MDTFGRDRFELLSAYLDGEVTAKERQQVQEWLENDPQMQQLYVRLLRLRQGMQYLPAPPTQQSSSQLSEAVFQKIDRRGRWRQGLLVGGGIAAVVIGAIASLTDAPVLQIASRSTVKNNPKELAIALNRPAVEIPPAAAPARGLTPFGIMKN